MALHQNPIVKKNINEAGFITWHDELSKAAAFKKMAKALDNFDGIYHTVGTIGNQYQNIDTRTSVRSPFTRNDYEYFRPTEQIPRLQKGIISSCMSAYEKIGIVRFVIDMMADFACQGIRLTHRDKATEDFYNQWWKQVRGPERSERFLNMFYRTANVIIKRSTAKLEPNMIQRWRRASAAPGELEIPENSSPDLDPEQPFIPERLEVPWRYTILNPLTLNMIGEELSMFSGDPYYTVQLPTKIFNMIKNPKNPIEQALVDTIPADIINGARNNQREIPLDPKKIITMHYKKDDWSVWATPMLYSILDDLIMLEKMKLADLTALDGAIHHIRIWKLGSLEHKIVPTDAAVQKLANLLLNNVGGGSMDLIWGPAIELFETSTDVQKFLGSDKYGPVLTAICAGLGVPLTVAGASDKGSYTNNFISLKTLIERLMYGRNALTAMWRKEIEIVQRAMNFRHPAQILYDNMNLSDDASEKMLWIQLADRNVISDQTLQEKFGEIPEVERARIKKEFQMRKDETMPAKISPFADASPDISYKKIALQRGLIGPSDLGIEGHPVMELLAPKAIPEQSPRGQPGQGRPKMSTDKTKRKTRTPKPNVKAEEFIEIAMWANQIQKEISDLINPIYFEKVNKSDLRSLTSAESRVLEQYKFTLLSNLEPFDTFTEEKICNDLDVYTDLDALKEEFVNKFVNLHSHSPSTAELRQIQSYAYAIFNIDEE